MSAAEIARFEQERLLQGRGQNQALGRSRQVEGLVTPQLETYRPLLDSIAIGAH